MCSFNTIDDFLRKTYQLIQRKKAKVEMFSQIFLFEGGMSVTKLKKVLTQKNNLSSLFWTNVQTKIHNNIGGEEGVDVHLMTRIFAKLHSYWR